jgi:hypothetical protein
MKVAKFTYIDIGANAKTMDYIDLLDKSLWDNEQKNIDAIRKQQRAGYSYVGDSPEYQSDLYADYKANRASYQAPFPQVDFYDTGELHKTMELESLNGEYNFFSKIDYYADLVKRYGENMFLLSPKFADIVRSANTKSYHKRYMEHLFKT